MIHFSGRTVYLVEEGANPSTEYFVLPQLNEAGLRVVRCHFEHRPDPVDLVGATVVFVRYVPAAWAKWLDRVATESTEIIFFMDDDVLDVRASAGMPLRYRFKLLRLAAQRKRWLQRRHVQLWVSTPYLQRKYADWDAQLLLPTPLPKPQPLCRVFYHGSASHAAEVRWLRPIIAEALECEPQLSFEIVGNWRVYRMYRDLPRVSIVHPMKWSNFQSFAATPGRCIGLAPLLDLPFNHARSYTKFFDITRCGAVGIYAAHSIYADVVTHDVDGILATMEPSAWVEAIVQLSRDSQRRLALLDNAEIKLDQLVKSTLRG